MKKWIKRIAKWLFYAFIASIVCTILLRFIPVYFTPLMLIRSVQQAVDEKREVRIQKDWEPIENISPNMANAVIAAEDQLFFTHYGFDFKAMQKAMQKNKKGKKIKGASTISQQTAKNVFLFPARTYFRKALEAYFTLLIEIFWSKERILEVYMNVVELGDGIYGVEAASQYYFKHSAKTLSQAEAALLAAVLPGPLKYKVNAPSGYIKKRQNWILRQMNNLGNVLPEEEDEEDDK